MHPAVIFGLSALATLVVLAACIRWLGPRGWMDHPGERKHHARPTPRVGGLALGIMVSVCTSLGCLSLHLTVLEWAAVVGMAGVGLLDDRFDLRARWKAVAGLAFAAPLAFVTTVYLLHSGIDVSLFGVDLPETPLVFFPLLLMWYWGVPQAFNLIDGLNGLSLGFTCLLLGALGLGPSVLPLWGILAALLVMNYPKARHFLGDTGSLLLGMLFTILVMKKALPVHRGLALWLMAYPVLDVVTVVAIRLATRQPLGGADRSHLHHWVKDQLGGRAWLVTPLLLALAALPMLRDLGWTWARPLAGWGALGLTALAVAVFVDRSFRRRQVVLEPADLKPVEPLRTFPLPQASGPN